MGTEGQPQHTVWELGWQGLCLSARVAGMPSVARHNPAGRSAGKQGAWPLSFICKLY